MKYLRLVRKIIRINYRTPRQVMRRAGIHVLPIIAVLPLDYEHIDKMARETVESDLISLLTQFVLVAYKLKLNM